LKAPAAGFAGVGIAATGWQHALAPVLLCVAALALAAGARYGLVEPADTTAHCDGGAQDAWCVVRRWTIQAFVNERIGWVAWGLALAGVLGASRVTAAAALFVASAGLVLYNTELCAPAALLAVLAWVREGQPAAAASTSNKPP
jgi:hypothetical protein